MKRWLPWIVVALGLGVAIGFAFWFRVRVSDGPGEATSDARAWIRLIAIYGGLAAAAAVVVIRSTDRRLRTTMAKALGWVGAILVTALGGTMLSIADTAVSASQSGFLDDVEQRTYEGDVEANLKAIHTALMLVHDSDGQFPDADRWMDAIANRLKTSDLSEEEAAKKLVNPDLAKGDGEYGFALNAEVAGKFVDDLDGPHAILVFESASLERNASGNPDTDAPTPERKGGNLAITVAGEIVRL
jgi:hypothetical protein